MSSSHEWVFLKHMWRNIVCPSSAMHSVKCYMHMQDYYYGYSQKETNRGILTLSGFLATLTHLLFRKRELPQQRNCPSAIMAIRSPSKSASSLQKMSTDNKLIYTSYFVAYPHNMRNVLIKQRYNFLPKYYII